MQIKSSSKNNNFILFMFFLTLNFYLILNVHLVCKLRWERGAGDVWESRSLDGSLRRWSLDEGPLYAKATVPNTSSPSCFVSSNLFKYWKKYYPINQKHWYLTKLHIRHSNKYSLLYHKN